MVYTKLNWSNSPSTTTPISSARLSYMETQYDEAVAYTNTRTEGVATEQFVGEAIQAATGARPTLVHHRMKDLGASIGLCNVFTVSTGGSFVPGVVGRSIASGTAPALSEFKTPLSFQSTTSAGLVANASGWDLTTGRIRGANILDGVAYGSLSAANPQDNAAVAYCNDGTLKYFEAALGDNTAKMISAGAIHSWSWGPALVLNGAAYNYASSGGWSALDTVSKTGRTVLGQRSNGDLVIFQIYGVTGSSGATVAETQNAILDENLDIAVLLDGGGSTSSAWQGSIAHVSSDSSSRKIPDTISIYAPAANSFNSLPVTLTPQSPYTQGAATLTARISSGRGIVSGNLSGNRTTPGNVQVTATGSMPLFIRNIRSQGVARFSGGRTGVSAIRNDPGANVIYIANGYTDGANNPDIYMEFDPNFGME